jgi:hypothetical protein
VEQEAFLEHLELKVIVVLLDLLVLLGLLV